MYTLPHNLVFWLYFFGLFVSHALGIWISNRNRNLALEKASTTMLIEGTLLSILPGFTFNTAFDKYSKRKQIISDEINNISTTKSLIVALPAGYRDSLERDI